MRYADARCDAFQFSAERTAHEIIQTQEPVETSKVLGNTAFARRRAIIEQEYSTDGATVHQRRIDAVQIACADE